MDIFAIMRVDCDLQGKALEIVLSEQSMLIKKKTPRGKERVINLLLTELYERRLKDTIAPPPPLNNKQWKKYLKTD